MDRGAWRATVHGVAKSQTQLIETNTFTFIHNSLQLRCASSIVLQHVACQVPSQRLNLHCLHCKMDSTLDHQGSPPECTCKSPSFKSRRDPETFCKQFSETHVSGTSSHFYLLLQEQSLLQDEGAKRIQFGAFLTSTPLPFNHLFKKYLIRST